MRKKELDKLNFHPENLSKDKELLDAISLVTAIFMNAKRRPAVRAAFFGILKSTAALLLAEDKKFPLTLQLLDRDAIRDGVGEPSPVGQLVKPVKRKKAVARRR